jgi:hypothetical protein
MPELTRRELPSDPPDVEHPREYSGLLSWLPWWLPMWVLVVGIGGTAIVAVAMALVLTLHI